MFRRAFIGWGLTVLGVGRWTWGPWRGSRVGVAAWAQPADAPLRYAPLTRPIRIPLDAVAVAWQPAAFTAEAMAPATPTSASRRVLISGVLFRRSARDGISSAAHLSALCLTCPHEQCQVDFVTDAADLARISGGAATRPLFECGCHSSTFDAQEDGARLSGETPRGLYRFRIASVNDEVVEINEIEEIALSEV